MKFFFCNILRTTASILKKKKKNPMFVYRWGQGTFKKLVLKNSLAIFKKWCIFKKVGVGHPVKISTPMCMLLNFMKNEMLFDKVVQMCFVSLSMPIAKVKWF